MDPRSDPEQQIEEARAALMAHLGELRRRLHAMRARVDLPAKIAAHPLPAVGAAFALGALLGMRGTRRRAPRQAGGEPGVGKLVLAALGALGVRLAKELALRGAAEAARGWWEGRQGEAAGAQAAYEPFLQR